jgi:hypothetical protein
LTNLEFNDVCDHLRPFLPAGIGLSMVQTASGFDASGPHGMVGDGVGERREGQLYCVIYDAQGRLAGACGEVGGQGRWRSVQGPPYVTSPFTVRDMTDLDHAFIVESWVFSYRWHPSSKQYPTKVYVHEMKWLVRELLKRCDVKVACLVSDPETVVGYLVSSEHGIHYLLTKKSPDFTRQGVATMLLKPWLERSDVAYGSRPIADLPIPEGWSYSPMIHARVIAEPRCVGTAAENRRNEDEQGNRHPGF